MSELLEELYSTYEEPIKAVTIATWTLKRPRWWEFWKTSTRKREFALSTDVSYAFIHTNGKYGTVRIPKDEDPQDVMFLSSHPQADQIERGIAEVYDNSRKTPRIKKHIWTLDYDEVAQGRYETIDEADILLIDDVELARRIDDVLEMYNVLDSVAQEGTKRFREMYDKWRTEIGLMDML